MRVFSALAALLLTAAAPTAGSADIGDDFVRLERGHPSAATMPAEARAVMLYYGASWCGPCRAFVPELVAAYPELRRRGIEVVFISDDAGCEAAIDYARTSRMPWLLLPCRARVRQHRLRALGGKTLPGLVTVDPAGRVLASSWHSNGDSVPRRALADVLFHHPAP